MESNSPEEMSGKLAASLGENDEIKEVPPATLEKRKSIQRTRRFKGKQELHVLLTRSESDPGTPPNSPPTLQTTPTWTHNITAVTSGKRISSAPSIGNSRLQGSEYKRRSITYPSPHSSFHIDAPFTIDGLPRSYSADSIAEEDDDMAKMDKQRTAIVSEIISTEETYISTLKKVIEQYLNPLRKEVTEGHSKFFLDGKPMTLEHVSIIFSNIEMIVEFNKNLLDLLHERQKNWGPDTKIGDVFIKLTPFLKLYTEYSTNHQKAIDLLKKAGKQCKGFQEFLDTRRAGGKHLLPPLDALIIQPVQRIPRYNLLLRDLIKHTSESHPDYKDLSAALAMMTKVAEHINESMKISDNFNKLIEIEHNFTKGLPFVCHSFPAKTDTEIQTLVEPFRYLIKEGQVTESSASLAVVNTYHTYLFNDCILWGKSLLLLGNKYKHHAPLTQTIAFDVPDSTVSFRIQTPGKTITVNAPKPQDKEEWIRAINDARDKQMETEGSKQKLLKKDEVNKVNEEDSETSKVQLRNNHHQSEMERIAMEAKKLELIKQKEELIRKKEEEDAKRDPQLRALQLDHRTYTQFPLRNPLSPITMKDQRSSAPESSSPSLPKSPVNTNREDQPTGKEEEVSPQVVKKRTPPPHPLPPIPKLSPEKSILSAFKGKDVLPWEQFEEAVADALHEPKEMVCGLQSLLGTAHSYPSLTMKGIDGQVRKDEWVNFSKWFSPLLQNDEADSKPGWTLGEVMDIVTPKWFFPYVPKDGIKQLLVEKGAFLVRFSSSGIGVYTLSAVNMNGQIGHWRITCHKPSNERGPAIFTMQDRHYGSLRQIIKHFSSTPLYAIGDKDWEGTLLEKPLDRTQHTFSNRV